MGRLRGVPGGGRESRASSTMGSIGERYPELRLCEGLFLSLGFLLAGL